MATAKNTDPCALAAGDLRHSINILAPTSYTSGASGMVPVYTTAFSGVRAKLDPVRGIELIRSGQDVSQVFITVTIRYMPGITTQMQVQAYHGTYRIQSIENVLERNRVLKLMCIGVSLNN